MNLKNDTGVPTYVIAAIVTSCAAPAGALNIWPRVEQMLQDGFSGQHLGIVLLVTMSALCMTAIPFAMKKAENVGFWTTCLLFGIFLTCLNYALAVGAVGKARDHESSSIEAIISQSKQLKERISELKALQPAASSFRYTTEEMVETARSAVELAKQARDQECGKVGDNCRARVAQLTARQSELAELVGNRSISSRVDRGNDNIRELEADLLRLGATPRSSDPQAERIGSLLTAIGIPARTEAVATGIIHILAIAAELFGLLMPRVLVTALGRGPENVLVKIGGNSAATVAPPLLPAPKASSKVASPTRPAPIPAWKSAVLRAKRGEKLNTWTAFQAYKKWASERGEAPGSFTQFCFELGLPKEEEAGKTYFVGWSLV
jgi:hypothetical protein